MSFNKKLFSKYKLVIFDLDNTIYDETLFLFTAYAAIANYVSDKYNLHVEEVEDFLVTTFKGGGRKNLFQLLINQYLIPAEEINVFLQIMRTSIPDTKYPIFPPVITLFNDLLNSGIKIGVLTNGHVQQQKNKVTQISWDGWDNNIHFYYANEIAPKPDPSSLDIILKDFNTPKETILFIGDSDTDEQFAANANIDFLHINNIISQ